MAIEPGSADPKTRVSSERLAGLGTHPETVLSTTSNFSLSRRGITFLMLLPPNTYTVFFSIPLSCQAGSAEKISSELAAVAKLHCSSLMRAESNSFDASLTMPLVVVWLELLLNFKVVKGAAGASIAGKATEYVSENPKSSPSSSVLLSTSTRFCQMGISPRVFLA
jgi:hypothetical protein